MVQHYEYYDRGRSKVIFFWGVKRESGGGIKEDAYMGHYMVSELICFPRYPFASQSSYFNNHSNSKI